MESSILLVYLSCVVKMVYCSQPFYDIWDLELLKNTVDIRIAKDLGITERSCKKRLVFHSQTKCVNEKDRAQISCKCKKAMIPCGSECHPNLNAGM